MVRFFSCFGNTEAETPAMNRLAPERDCFRAVLCELPNMFSVPCRHLNRDVSAAMADYLLLDASAIMVAGIAQWLDPKRPMLARSRQASSATGHFGKWHMGGQRDMDRPAISEYGFDASLTNFEGMGG